MINQFLNWLADTLLWFRSPSVRRMHQLRRAERIAARHGYGVYKVAAIDKATTDLGVLWQFTLHSGHLTRAYHAGRTIRQLAGAVTDQLVAARS